MKKLVFAGILCLFSLSIFSQPPANTYRPGTAPAGLIKGRVIDAKTKKPMEFASVAVYRAKDSTLVTGGISGPDGSFALKDIPNGKYYLVANFMGYNKKMVNGVSLGNGNHTFDAGSIVLSEATQNLDEVEVVGNQPRVEYKIDRKVINVGQDINASTGTAADVLENTPSVSVDIEGNVSLRGSTSFQVLIDGKPTPLSGSDALQQIPASAIKNIEIITNPSAKFDPDGMAGIINIITKKNALQGLSGVFNAKIGTNHKYSGDFLLSYRTSKFNVYGGLTYQDNQYHGSFLYDSKFNSGSLTHKFGERNMQRNGKEGKVGIDYYLNDKNTLSLTGEIGNHQFSFGGIQKIHYYTEPATIDSFTRSTMTSFHGGDYYSANLSYTHKFDDKGHELVAYFNYERSKGNDGDLQLEYPATPDYVIDDSDTTRSIFGTRSNEPGNENEYRIKVDYTKPLGEDGRFQAGYQARIDDQYEAFNFFRYYPENPVDRQWLADSKYTTGNDFYRDIQAVYATYGNKLGNYQFQLGLRGEYTDRSIKDKRAAEPATINRFDLFPSLHLARNFENGHQVMISYSRRINRPRGWYLEPFITYVDAQNVRQGDPRLKPEYLNSYELGYQKSFGKSFVSLEGYYRSTIDKIDRLIQVYPADSTVLLHTYGNVASDRSLGAELMIDYSELKWLELNLSGSMYRYSEKGVLEGENISKRSNNWDTRLNATFNFSTKTRLQVQAFYNGPSVTIQGKRDGFFFTNLALRHDFLDRKLSATLQVRDLLGTAKFEQTSYGNGFETYMRFTREPRIVMLSLSYKLNNFKQKRQGNMDNGNEDMSGEGEVY